MAGLSAFIQRLERLAAADVKGRVLARVRDAAHAEAVRGFVDQRDPYGRSWAPRKDKRGTWPILRKTGAGLDGLTARVVGDRVVMRIAGYFKFHQSGTRFMVARMVFPEPARGLGTWSGPINDAARDAVRELVEGR
jgi:hypothetical protein